MSSAGVPAALRKVLTGFDKLAVAFSGGVDSTFLAAAARAVLGKDAVLLLFADSPFAAARERAFARNWAEEQDLRLLPVPAPVLEHPEIVRNDPERCYFCKKLLMGRLLDRARAEGFAVLADGANLDDRLDYRPGARAADELGVRHPLCEANFDKAAIRHAARALGLANHDAPAAACLASRIPSGMPVTAEKLAAADAGETVLLAHGFRGARLRHYGTLAKIEVVPEDLARAWACREKLLHEILQLGFRNVALDLAGYRRGAVNGAPEPETQSSTNHSRGGILL